MSEPRILEDNPQSVAQNQLKSFFERIERLDEEKKSISEDIKDVYAEAKATGFDTKIMKKVAALMKLSKQEREENEALIDTYMSALGA